MCFYNFPTSQVNHPQKPWDEFPFERSCLMLSGLHTLAQNHYTHTKPEHHFVGEFTGDITPCFTIFSISSLTLGSNGCGILLGVYKQTGFASSHNLILYVYWSLTFPKLLKRFGNSSLKSTRDSETSLTLTLVISPHLWHACLLSKEHSWYLMTYISSLSLFPLCWRVAWNLPSTGSLIRPGP